MRNHKSPISKKDTPKIHKGTKARAYPASVEVLRRFMTYNSDTGQAATIGGYNTKPRDRDNGYTYISLPHDEEATARGRRESFAYRMDHIAWYYATGEWPSGWIEHVNGFTTDNSLDNLVHLDAEGIRWWFGAQDGDVVRRLVRVDNGEDGPAIERVTLKGNFGADGEDGEDEYIIRPRIAKGWAERASEGLTEATIETAEDYEPGEFGKDWV